MLIKLLTSSVIIFFSFVCSYYIRQSHLLKLKTYINYYNFALNAERNLRNELKSIYDLLSENFNSDMIAPVSAKEFVKFGLSTEDAELLADYVYKYSYMELSELKKETQKLSETAEKALYKVREEYKKGLPSLLCPPTCAIIAVILMI